MIGALSGFGPVDRFGQTRKELRGIIEFDIAARGCAPAVERLEPADRVANVLRGIFVS
jgi:hypothetical protein